MEKSDSGDIPAHAPSPPAADIPGAIAKTEYALVQLGDADKFEQIAVYCLEQFEPSLRQTGGVTSSAMPSADRFSPTTTSSS